MAVHWGFALIGIFFWLVVLAAVALVVVVVVRLLMGHNRPLSPPGYPAAAGGPQGLPPTAPRETPLDILARRFAAGEISADEYQKARDLLLGGTNPPAS